ncbi:MAG: cation-transporting P-type ATPase [Ignavibacteriales bacterium]
MRSAIEPKTNNWHSLLFTDVANQLNVVLEKGLDESEVITRRVIYGPNIVSTKKAKHPILRFLLQLREPLMFILVAAGIVTAVIEEWVDSVVIFGFILVTATAGFVQEMKAGKAMEALIQALNRRFDQWSWLALPNLEIQLKSHRGDGK